MTSLEGVGGCGGENSTVVESREWVMSAYAAEGVPTSDHLKLRTTKLSLDANSIPDGHVAVELLWISVDPYLRTRMTGRDDGLYFSQFALNEVHILQLNFHILIHFVEFFLSSHWKSRW